VRGEWRDCRRGGGFPWAVVKIIDFTSRGCWRPSAKSDHTTFVHRTGSVAYGGAAILAARTGQRPVPPKLVVRHCATLVWFDLDHSQAAARGLSKRKGSHRLPLSAALQHTLSVLLRLPKDEVSRLWREHMTNSRDCSWVFHRKGSQSRIFAAPGHGLAVRADSQVRFLLIFGGRRCGTW